MKFRALNLLLFLLLYVLSVAAQSDTQLVLGNPSKAKNEIKEQNNYLVNHTSFILSYNKERGAANWVFWHLEKSDIGKVDRSNAFAPDIFLPQDWWILPNDYSGSGYDRGHLCPSKDRSDSDARNIETFLMSNMQPQAEKLNRQTWRYLEDYTREIVGRDNEAYIFAGCYGEKGKIKEKVAIPTQCFKIIVLLALGEDDLKRVDEQTRVIAVDMPNDESVSSRWRTYLTTVDAIEEKTGYDFLSSVSKKIQKEIESKIDDQNRENNTETDTSNNQKSDNQKSETQKSDKTDKPDKSTSEDSSKKSEKPNKGDRTYIMGSKGGCYYLNDSGKKVYVKDKSLCENQSNNDSNDSGKSSNDKKEEKTSNKKDSDKENEKEEEQPDEDKETSKDDAKQKDDKKPSKDGRTYIKGSRGGCYYINDSGKKVYVKDKSLCEGQ